MEVEKKVSFSDIVSSVEAQKHNSDLQNLAHALKYAESGILELLKAKKAAEDLIVEIKVMAQKVEHGGQFDYADVKSLYDRSRKIGINL